MLNTKYPAFYKYLFFIIVAFYGLVLSRFGLENFDTGYIPSFSWRIINNQHIYEDFIYKGPPVTLYFHAFLMYCLPENGQFFFIRISNYLLFALQVYCMVDAFFRLYDFKAIKIQKWGLICTGFIVSLLNFSPYPWPTTDGILFAAIAFWLVSKWDNQNFFNLFTIAFFCMLSALTKQSFYLVPLMFLCWIFVKYDFRKTCWFALQLLLLAVLYLTIIVSITDFQNFLQQTTGETHLHDLFYTGFHNYIFISVSAFLLVSAIVGLSVFIYLKSRQLPITALSPYLKWLAVLVFSVALVFCAMKEIELASRIAFDAAIIALVYAFFTQKKRLEYLMPMLVTLGIAWSSSISLGYQFPILFATGIILCFVVLIAKDLNLKPGYYLLIALPVCCVAFSYNIKPYREPVIFDLRYDLESVSPKLKYIKTSKANFEKYTELKQLINKYGNNFIVAPNIPMANYLFNNQSELPADWIIETEVARRQKLFIRLASDKKNYIFLEKSFLQHEAFMPENKEDFSSISAFIYDHFDRIDETNYFLIYHSLKKNETLP